MYDMLQNAISTEFLDEPAYRWFFAIFIFAMMVSVWHSILEFIKGAG